jgi:hypothetical protein
VIGHAGRAAALIAVIGVVGAFVLALSVVAPRTRSGTTNDSPATLGSSPDTDTPSFGPAPEVPEARVRRLGSGGRAGPIVLRADRDGRITARFRFDAASYDLTRLTELTMTARGASGNTAEYRGTEAWPTPPEWPDRPYSPWGEVRKDQADRIAHLSERIRRLESHQDTARLNGEQETRILAELRAELASQRQRLAPDGVCPAAPTPRVFVHDTRGLGDHVFLGCHFEPGERVEATLQFRPLTPDEVRAIESRPRLEGPSDR